MTLPRLSRNTIALENWGTRQREESFVRSISLLTITNREVINHTHPSLFILHSFPPRLSPPFTQLNSTPTDSAHPASSLDRVPRIVSSIAQALGRVADRARQSRRSVTNGFTQAAD